MEKEIRCPACEEKLSMDAKYCGKCGISLYVTEELVQRAAKKDQNAIANLYILTYKDIYWTIKSTIHDEDMTYDILQDAYIKGFDRLSQLEKPGSYKPWMKSIASHEALNYLKKKKEILFTDMGEEDSDYEIDIPDTNLDALPEEVLDKQETTRLVRQMLDNLSDEQRFVVGLFYYQQMSVKEIAEMLDCSENTVKSRLRYARSKIEEQVVELEKKGTKLYGLAPFTFFIWLLLSENKDVPLWAATRMDGYFENTQSGDTTDHCHHDEDGYSDTKSNTSSAGKTSRASTTGMQGAATAAKTGIGMKVAALLLGGAIAGGALAGGVAIKNNMDNRAQQEAAVAHNEQEDEEGKQAKDDTKADTDKNKSRKSDEKESKAKETAKPDEAETDKNDQAKEAYQSVLATFGDLRSATEQEAYDDSKMDEYKTRFSNINSYVLDSIMIGDTYTPSHYAYYDVDHNGVEELVIAGGDVISDPYIVEIYTYDGNSAHELYGDTVLAGGRTKVTIFDNGIISYYSSGSASSGNYGFYKISADGYTVETLETAEVLYDEYYSQYLAGEITTNGMDVISGDEYQAKLAQYTEMKNYDWQELPAAFTPVDVTAQYQGTVTPMLNYFDYYLCYEIMSGTAGSVDSFVFDDYTKTNMVCYAEHIYSQSVAEAKNICNSKLQTYFGADTKFVIQQDTGQPSGAIESLYVNTNETVRYNGGDYGDSTPVGKVTRIEQTGESTYDVTYEEHLNYYDGSGQLTDEYRGTYHIILNLASNEFGFIITNITRTDVAAS